MRVIPFIVLLIVALTTGPAVIAKEDVPETVGKSEGPEGTEPVLMTPEALQKCRARCMAFQETLEEVGSQVEMARMEANDKKKLSILIMALENLITEMQMHNAACPAMEMHTSKAEAYEYMPGAKQ